MKRQHHRDYQRSLCYAWEDQAVRLNHLHLRRPAKAWESLADIQAWIEPIWRQERARYGVKRKSAPAILRPHWGQRRALAQPGFIITLPRWARTPWVVLHELAHHLAWHDGHGPRFVGILIGLVSRHLGYDAVELMRLADERGLQYRVNSIGTVPTHSIASRALEALRAEGDMTSLELALWLSIGSYHEPVTELQVRAALLQSMRAGTVRMWRGKLRALPPVQQQACARFPSALLAA